MKNPRVLVVDDSASTLRSLQLILEEEGYEVVAVATSAEAERVFQAGPPFDLVLADLKLPDMDGLDLFRCLSALDPHVQFVIMTAHGTIESSVQAMKEGVYDYLVKPLNPDELLVVLSKALRERRQKAELRALREEVQARYSFHNIVGQSPAMQRVFEVLQAVAPTDATVLITGETGTGKELIAKAIHFNSPRRHRPLVAINCAALSESLLEAELFGYVKGAFTGAVSNRIGKLEAAHQGTLFLDEVGRMSPALQTKLLRFLQEKTFEPVGSITPRTVDVRVIAATNQDLAAEVRAGRFLPDLYYRLQVIPVHIPPLRERKDDIPLLAAHFLKAAIETHGLPDVRLSNDVVDALMAYDWPGNVRELRNAIERMVILARSDTIGLEDLPPPLREAASAVPPAGQQECIAWLPPGGRRLKDVERELIVKTLRLFHGNRSEAARALGISRKSLYERLKRFGLG